MTAGTLKPMRLDMKSAGELLSLTADGIRKLIQSGVLTGLTPNGRGRGKRMYVLPGEVEAYATGGLEGVVNYRKAQTKKAKK